MPYTLQIKPPNPASFPLTINFIPDKRTEEPRVSKYRLRSLLGVSVKWSYSPMSVAQDITVKAPPASSVLETVETLLRIVFSMLCDIIDSSMRGKLSIDDQGTGDRNHNPGRERPLHTKITHCGRYKLTNGLRWRKRNSLA